MTLDTMLDVISDGEDVRIVFKKGDCATACVVSMSKDVKDMFSCDYLFSTVVNTYISANNLNVICELASTDLY